jgi:chaperone modulatory protein CbpM
VKKTTSRSDIIDDLNLSDLCRFCRVEQTWVIELVNYGVLEPQGSAIEKWRFHGVNIARAKKASRLNQDLGVNVEGVALVLSLLEERDAMRRRLARYEFEDGVD